MRWLTIFTVALLLPSALVLCALPVDANSQTPKSGYIRVLLPTGADNAAVMFGQHATQQKGLDRLFVTPPLAPGSTYSYELTATWSAAGKEVKQIRTISVTPGQTTTADFTIPQGFKKEEFNRAGQTAKIPEGRLLGGSEALEELRLKTKDQPITQEEARQAMLAWFRAGATPSDFFMAQAKQLEQAKLIARDAQGDPTGPERFAFGRWTVNLQEKTFAGDWITQASIYTFKGAFYFEDQTWKAKTVITGIGHKNPVPKKR